MPVVPPTSPRHFRFGPVFSSALVLLRTQLAPALLVATLASMPMLVVVVLALTGTIASAVVISSPWATFFGALSSGLTIAAMMPAALRRDRGGQLPAAESVRLGLASMARGLGPSVAVAACVAAGGYLATIAGALISIVLAFAVAVAVTEERRPGFVVRRSASLVNRRGATMLGLLVTLGLIQIAPMLVLSLALGVGDLEPSSFPAMLIGTVVNDILSGALAACVITTAYWALRRDEAPPAEHLRAVFA
jgi:hypothetical protein